MYKCFLRIILISLLPLKRSTGRRRVMQRVEVRDGLLWHLHV
jgi:hypothetical protein